MTNKHPPVTEPRASWSRRPLLTRLSRFVASGSLNRATILLSILIVLNIVVVADYYAGRMIPPWDFLGSYNTEAYYWWQMGGFFRPVEWIPSTWAGYPGALNLQNSAWYLPVGVFAFFAPFTLHSAAILAALHTSAGFVSMYALLRSRNIGFAAATLGATSWFFAPGFFANAQHVDISRGYALLPLLLLVTSSRWRWKSLWGVAVTAVVVWQVAIGVYPGIVIAAIYVGLVWVAASQLLDKPRFTEYVAPLLAALAIAALLSVPRFSTFLILGNSGASGLPDSSMFTWPLLGTLFFGFGSPELPNDISMRSFFLPALILLLIPFAAWKSRSALSALALLIPAAVLGLPFWPWFALAQELPGLGASRFTMSDFKPFLLIAFVILAATAAEKILRWDHDQKETLRPAGYSGLVVRAIASLAVLAIATLAFVNSSVDRAQWLLPLTVALISLTVIALFFFLPAGTPAVLARTSLALAMVALSGYAGIMATPQTWRADRIATETIVLTAPVDTLLQQQATTLVETARRPGRLPLPDVPVTADLYNNQFNRTYYSGEQSVGGYVNFKGVQTQALIAEALVSAEVGPQFARFLAAPGTLMAVDPGESIDAQFDRCAMLAADDPGCDTIDAQSVSYSPGEFVYRISSPRAVSVLTNEAYYGGWTASGCDDEVQATCVDITVTPSEFGVVQLELPAGQYELRLDYQTPGGGWPWVTFWLGVGGIVTSVILSRLVSSRRDRQRG